MDQLRALVEAADKDKVDLLNQLEEERRYDLSRTQGHYLSIKTITSIYCVF